MQHRRVGNVVIGILLPPCVQQVQTNSQNQIWRENLIEAYQEILAWWTSCNSRSTLGQHCGLNGFLVASHLYNAAGNGLHKSCSITFPDLQNSNNLRFFQFRSIYVSCLYVEKYEKTFPESWWVYTKKGVYRWIGQQYIGLGSSLQ